jgi:hypothetical protein
MTPDWEKRLCNLVKKYRPPPPEEGDETAVATFRNDFRDLAAIAGALPKIGPAGAELLRQAREYLEGWASPATAPDAATALVQWQQLYEAGKDRLPWPVWEAFMRRLPDGDVDSSQVEALLASSRDPRPINALLGRKLIKEKDLLARVEADPGRYYGSATLDALVLRDTLGEQPKLWEYCVRADPRPRDLLSREAVLAKWFGRHTQDRWSARMWKALRQENLNRLAFFGLLLDDGEASLRLCWHALFAPAGGKGGGDASEELVQRDWLAACEEELSKTVPSRAMTASLVTGLLRFSSAARPRGPAAAVEESAATLTRRTILSLLQTAEAGTPSDLAAIFAVGPHDLYAIFQEYLRRLPGAGRGGGGGEASDTPTDRSARLERHRGRKDVIAKVVAAMEDAHGDGNALRDGLEVALFNCGVRPLGEPGHRVQFDPHVHQTGAAGVAPGDPVIVERAGRRIGEGEDTLVIAKAIVASAG